MTRSESRERVGETKPYLFLYEANRIGFEGSRSKFKVLAYGNDRKEAIGKANGAISEYIMRMMMDIEDGILYGVAMDLSDIAPKSLTEKQRKIMDKAPFGETTILFKKFPFEQ